MKNLNNEDIKNIFTKILKIKNELEEIVESDNVSHEHTDMINYSLNVLCELKEMLL